MKKRYVYSSIAFLAAFILYLITVSHTIGFTDSGELAGVCVTLGLAHPTGYPLFALIGHLWSLLPLPISKIYSLNIFASFATALSVAVFFNLAYEILNYLNLKTIEQKKKLLPKKNPKTSTVIDKPVSHSRIDNNIVLLVALISALIYAFARTIWEQAVEIEVYSLHLLMINTVLLLMVKAIFVKENQKVWLMLAALALGLSFSNHMTTILLIPALVFIFFKRPEEKFDLSTDRWKSLLWLLIPFVLGLSFYLYLPLRSATQPDFNWGYVSRGLDKLLYHIQGKQYQVWMFSDSAIWGVNFQKFIDALPLQLAWIGLLPMLWGMIKCLKKSKELFWVLSLLVIACLFYSLNYSIHDIESYFATAFLALILFTGIGLMDLVSRKKELVYAFLIIPLLSIPLNYTENNSSNEYQVEEYTHIMAENLAPNAIIISAQWDYFCSAFWYMQRVEHYRTDVSLIEKELLRRTWYPYQLKRWYPELMKQSEFELNNYMKDLELFESNLPYNPSSIQRNFIALLNSFIDKNIGKRPIYLTLDILQTEPEVAKNYEKIPEGLAFRIEKERKAYPVSVDNLNFDKFLTSINGKEGHLYEGIRNVAGMSIANLAKYASLTGQAIVSSNAWDLAYRINPKNPAIIEGFNSVRK